MLNSLKIVEWIIIDFLLVKTTVNSCKINFPESIKKG